MMLKTFSFALILAVQAADAVSTSSDETNLVEMVSLNPIYHESDASGFDYEIVVPDDAAEDYVFDVPGDEFYPEPDSAEDWGFEILDNHNALHSSQYDFQGCGGGRRKAKFVMHLDEGGSIDGNSYVIKSEGGATVAKSNGITRAGGTVSRQFCLRPGIYEVIVKDGKGFYSFSVVNSGRWKQLVQGGGFERNTVTHTVNIARSLRRKFKGKGKGKGKGRKISGRSALWLRAHNLRRMKYHRRFGRSYVPMTWSPALANQSRMWAATLARTCRLRHDPRSSWGENLALDKGFAKGKKKSPNSVLTRFVEMEANKPFGKNSHFMQVIWRASKYVGCGEASSGKCNVQVCRYARPGNCNISRSGWKAKMLANTSPCGKACPPDGCK